MKDRLGVRVETHRGYGIYYSADRNLFAVEFGEGNVYSSRQIYDVRDRIAHVTARADLPLLCRVYEVVDEKFVDVTFEGFDPKTGLAIFRDADGHSIVEDESCDVVIATPDANAETARTYRKEKTAASDAYRTYTRASERLRTALIQLGEPVDVWVEPHEDEELGPLPSATTYAIRNIVNAIKSCGSVESDHAD